MEIYEGGNEYADIVRNFTTSHKQTKVSVPGNQMFVKCQSRSTIASKGFKAFIHRIGKLIL